MDPKTLGRFGEDEAVRHLRAQGWTILDRNVRLGRKEVDVIILRGRVLAFVEVKCRSTESHGHPSEAITPLKQRQIAEVARAWLRDRRPSPGTLIRFDAVSVTCSQGETPRVEHLEDAWRLG